jgi:hypothetical protein
MTGSSVTGPTILWNQLKGKQVKTHDGKDIGEIKEISQHYLRLEKGTISKDKFWIPKYIADAYDGENVWVVANEDEVKENLQEILKHLKLQREWMCIIQRGFV